MANRFSLNEGSLTRRTILHVIAFVVGTALFLAVASLALVTIGKTVTSDGKSSDSASDSAADDSPASSGTGAAGKPMIRPIKKKGAAAAKPAEDEDQ